MKSEHSRSGEGRKKWPVSAQPEIRPTPGRTSASYWRERVERVLCTGGKPSPNYSIRISHQQRRTRFPLYTSNKEAASTKAAQIFRYLIEHGWDETIAKFKPHTVKGQTASKPDTVGDLIRVSIALSSARPQSKEAYKKAFRRLVSGALNIERPKKAESSGSYTEWRDLVDAVKLTKVTPAKVIAWKNRYLENAGPDPLAQRSAKTTVNSVIRNSKALFSKKLLPFLTEEVELPAPLPLEGVPMEKPSSMRYQSKIDARKIFIAAREGLAHSDPEQFKVLLLALVCGLRISEIDHLLWESFDFDRAILRVESTKFHELKSADSGGEIDLNSEMVTIFSEFRTRAEGMFVVDPASPPRLRNGSRHYRCKKTFDSLRRWLRSQGVSGKLPIHELRKEVGSLIASEHGIFEASRFLRHSDIRITAAIYVDKKKRVTPSFMTCTDNHE